MKKDENLEKRNRWELTEKIPDTSLEKIGGDPYKISIASP